MNVKSRAHRILRPMTRYRQAGAEAPLLVLAEDPVLGTPLGVYQNPEPDRETVTVYAHGIAWGDGARSVRVGFSEIADVDLSNGKESQELLLTLKDRRLERLPIRGRVGRFYDSLEFLRFLSRVLGDLGRAVPRSTSTGL
jgi:hypothetical protein